MVGSSSSLCPYLQYTVCVNSQVFRLKLVQLITTRLCPTQPLLCHAECLSPYVSHAYWVLPYRNDAERAYGHPQTTGAAAVTQQFAAQVEHNTKSEGSV